MPFRRFVKPLSRLLGGPDADPHARTERAAPGPAGAAGGGGEEATREAAVRALPDGEALRTLAGLAGASAGEAAAVERIAQERVAQLIDSGTIDFDGICAASSNAAAVLAVAGHCGDPARLPQALARFDGRSEPYTWFYRITINLSLNTIRSRKTARTSGQSSDDPRLDALLVEKRPSAMADPPGDAQRKQLYAALCEGVDELSDTLRTTLILVCIDGRSHEEASAILGAPEGTIAWRVHEARRKLRAFMLGKGFDPEGDGT